jgi:hypothetical protein
LFFQKKDHGISTKIFFLSPLILKYRYTNFFLNCYEMQDKKESEMKNENKEINFSFKTQMFMLAFFFFSVVA